MTSEQQEETINELAEVVLKDNPHIRAGRVRRGVAGFYNEFKGSGNAYNGFKNIAISTTGSSIILRLDLDPSIHYDCFRPNPHFSLFEATDIDEAKNIIKQMLKFSDNLKSGLGKLSLK